MWLQKKYALWTIKNHRAAAVYTVQRWPLRCARDARSPRYWVRSGASRNLPSAVTIECRTDVTMTRRRHVTWPLLNALRMFILVGRLKNYRSSSSSSSWGDQNQLLIQLLLLCKRATSCDEVCSPGTSSARWGRAYKVKKSRPHSARQAAGTPTDPPLYHWCDMGPLTFVGR